MRRATLPLAAVLLLAAPALPRGSARAFEVVLNAQGEFLDAYLDGVTVVDSSRFGVNFRRLLPAVELAPAVCGGE